MHSFPHCRILVILLCLPSILLQAQVILPDSSSRVTPAPGGVLHVQSDPAGAWIELDSLRVGTTPATLNTVSPAQHRLRIVLPEYRAYERMVDCTASDTMSVNATLIPEFGFVTIQADPPEGRVVLDGTDWAAGSGGERKLGVGAHTVSVIDPGSGRSVTSQFHVSPGARIRLRGEPNGFSWNAFQRSLLFPGLGQAMDNASGEMLGFVAASAVCISLLTVDNIVVYRRQNDYNDARDVYEKAITEPDANTARIAMEARYRDLQDASSHRLRYAYAFGAVYVINLIDVLLFHSKPTSLDVVDIRAATTSDGSGLSHRFSGDARVVVAVHF